MQSCRAGANYHSAHSSKPRENDLPYGKSALAPLPRGSNLGVRDVPVPAKPTGQFTQVGPARRSRAPPVRVADTDLLDVEVRLEDRRLWGSQGCGPGR